MKSNPDIMWDQFSELSDVFQLLIPLNGKVPIEQDWTYFCETTRLFDKSEFKGLNAGITCGPANGIIVIDVDHIEKFEKMRKENGWGEGAQTSGMLLGFDEFKALVSKVSIKNSALLPCINTLFETTIHSSHIKNHSVEYDDVHISILEASTKNTYQSLYTPSFIDIGFPIRIFLVTGSSERKFPIPPPMNPNDIKLMELGLVDILKYVGAGRTLTVDPDAYELYEQ